MLETEGGSPPRAGWWRLMAAGVVLLVAGAAGGYVVGSSRSAADRGSPPAATISASTSSDPRRSLPAVRGATTVSLPREVAGLTLRDQDITDDFGQLFLRGLRGRDFRITKSADGLYVPLRRSSNGDPLNSIVTLFVAESPRLESDTIFTDWLMPSFGRTAREAHTLVPWPYEGQSMCWLTDAYYCVWADRTSFGAVLFNAQPSTTARAREYFATIRAAVERPVHPQ
ncbi:hypothetical protein [Nonomuraea sp. NPDC049784]|uniref:hypothetical protein n=1 Tax=Nonomuraea sp. NPDC049784 TaxID=3154361 RepID=UPI0033E371C6